MAVTIETPADVQRTLEPVRAELLKANDPEARAKAKADALAPFAPGAMYAYVDDAEKRRASQRVEADQETKIGEGIFTVEHTAKDLEPTVEAWERDGREAPDPVTAWQRARGQGGVLPPAEVQNLGILAEFQIARFEREFGEALPSKVQAAYVAALARPLEQANANLIRWVEGRHAATWTGRGIDGHADEAMAAHRLHQVIAAARDARIPADVKAARAAIQEAYAQADKAKTSRVRSQRPALYGVA